MAEVRTERRDRRASYRAPSLFVSFASPLILKDHEFEQALRRFAIHLRPPKAILVASAQWHTVRPLRVTASRRPGTVKDLGPFPAWLARDYPCAGSPGVAAEAVGLLSRAGIPAVQDMSQALDPGAWIPLSLMYSAANVPVVEVSLPAFGDPEEMLAIGKALAPLRAAGVLIVGSGAVVHNPHRARFDNVEAPPEPWAIAFDNWVRERLEAFDVGSLLDYRRRGPQAHLCAPTPEYLNPLFFVLGTGMAGDRVTPVFEGFHAASVSLRTCVLAGRRREDLRLPDELVGRRPA